MNWLATTNFPDHPALTRPLLLYQSNDKDRFPARNINDNKAHANKSWFTVYYISIYMYGNIVLLNKR